jgi:hypothetical protein
MRCRATSAVEKKKSRRKTGTSRELSEDSGNVRVQLGPNRMYLQSPSARLTEQTIPNVALRYSALRPAPSIQQLISIGDAVACHALQLVTLRTSERAGSNSRIGGTYTRVRPVSGQLRHRPIFNRIFLFSSPILLRYRLEVSTESDCATLFNQSYPDPESDHPLRDPLG